MVQEQARMRLRKLGTGEMQEHVILDNSAYVLWGDIRVGPWLLNPSKAITHTDITTAFQMGEGGIECTFRNAFPGWAIEAGMLISMEYDPASAEELWYVMDFRVDAKASYEWVRQRNEQREIWYSGGVVML